MANRETGRVIKAAAVRQTASRIAFDFEDVQERCEAQVADARRRATELLETATREAESIRETARAEARAAGRAEGLADAEAQIVKRADAMARSKATEAIGTLAPALREAAERLAGERDRWITEWEGRAIDLAVAIAGRIVRTEIAAHPEHVRDVLGNVLRLVAGGEEVTVRLHPADATTLGDDADQVVSSMTACARANVVADDSIERGGCVVSTRHGEIDARVASQLDRIAAELRGGPTREGGLP